ncbi:hypothetical protein [Streptomyces sp. CBMA152]|uniref:hypothetical protein n=1 Tax=Streptomyces sp. CBMA152 TaxID=1896312 RepID=UPI00166055C8|nr:hypothetical protein [Streptomyces sp. CBMA152]MBD0743121.1 hypothetical protein [Streptomyces sp. CBMA152]
MITDTEVARLLHDSGHLLDEWDSDTEIALDSLTFVWLVHLLEERHGIVVTSEIEEELATSDSIGALHRQLLRMQSRGGPGLPEEVRHGA